MVTLAGATTAMTRARLIRSLAIGARTAGAAAVVLAGAAGAACGAGATDAPPPASPKSGTIRIDRDSYNPSQGAVIEYWMNLWKQRHPTIQLELRAGINGDKMVTMLAAGEQGELIDFNATIYAHYKGQPGLLADVTAMLKQKKVNVNDYFDIPEITTFREKRYGFIYRALVFGWWLNRGAFEAKSVPLPTESWTYDDMLDAARRLTDTSNPDAPVYGVELRPMWNVFALFRAAGVEYLNKDASKTMWDTPQSVNLLQWLLDVIHRHRAAPAPQLAAEKQLAYDRGNVLMREGLTGSKATQRAIGDRIRWENAWPPRWKATGKRSLLIDGNAWHVTGKAQQANLASEALDLLLLFLGPEVQEQNLVNEGFGMPIPKKLATDPRFAGPPPDSLKIVPDMWKDGKTYDRIVGGREWLGALTPPFTDALNGKLSAGELARQMTDAGNAVLARVTVPSWGRT